jgi:GPH family glycoside/pentoside/hexuronide:cation symporter
MNLSPPPSPTEKLSLKTSAIYGLGTVAFGVKDHGFNVLLMLFYNQVLGLPASWVGMAIMIAMVFDALFDPLLGQYSDNVRTRWGRRHPFMYAAILPVAISYLFLWMPPSLGDQGLFIWLLISAIAVRVSVSLYEIPSTALLAEFTDDYDERTKLVAARFFFGAVGGVAMMMLSFGVFLKPSADQPVGHLNLAGYSGYAIAAAIVMTFAIAISALGTQKRILQRPAPPPPVKTTIGVMLKEMLSILVHPAYISILLASIFFAIASGLTLSLQVYFWTYLWELSSGQIASISSAILLGLLLALTVVLPVAVRFGKKQIAIGLFLLSLACTSTPLLLRLNGMFLTNGDPLLLYALMGFLSFAMMCTISGGILAVSMVADVTDQIQLDTGKQSEGLLFSAATMVNKAISGMGILMAGLILSFAGFPEAATPGHVPPDALAKLAIIFLCAVAASTVLAVICLAFYPITRQKHLHNLQQLRARAAS